MKLLFVHAHYDDYEFTAAGTFERWRRERTDVSRRVLVCTDGAVGHQSMTREETALRRYREQEAASAMGGFEFRLLRDRRGVAFREGRLHASSDFLPVLWREIRDFEPDYLFCPPIPEDPLVGVHVDHLEVAQAVRSVAYLLNVPHAYAAEFDLPEGTAVSVRTPVIVNTYDGYMTGGHGHDLAVDVAPYADLVADLAGCHESQLREWLPWVNRHHLEAPPDAVTWRRQFRAILERQRLALGVEAAGVYEFFTVTAWGVVPTLEQLRRDFPGIHEGASRLDRLERRLNAWRGAAGDSVEASAAPRRRSAVGPEEAAEGGDPATIRRRLEIVLGGPPGFNTGAKAGILADLLVEFGRPRLVEMLRREWLSQFDTGADSSPAVVRPPSGT